MIALAYGKAILREGDTILDLPPGTQVERIGRIERRPGRSRGRGAARAMTLLYSLTVQLVARKHLSPYELYVQMEAEERISRPRHFMGALEELMEMGYVSRQRVVLESSPVGSIKLTGQGVERFFQEGFGIGASMGPKVY